METGSVAWIPSIHDNLRQLCGGIVVGLGVISFCVALKTLITHLFLN